LYLEPEQSSEADIKKRGYTFGVAARTKTKDPAHYSIGATVRNIERDIDAYTKPEQLTSEEVQ